MCFAKALAYLIPVFVFLFIPVSAAHAQSYQRELDTPEKVSLSIVNRNGRASIIASDEQQKKVTIEASSRGAAVDPSDLQIEANGASIEITVRDRSEKNRIDLVARIPVRSKVKVHSDGGAIDVVAIWSRMSANGHRHHPRRCSA